MEILQDRTIDLTSLGGIRFQENTHRYFNADDIQYTGITTLIGRYHEHFDVEKTSLNKAIKTVVREQLGYENLDKLNRQVYAEQVKEIQNNIHLSEEQKDSKLEELTAFTYFYTKASAFEKKKPLMYKDILIEQDRLKIEWEENRIRSTTEGTAEHDKRERSIIENGYEWGGKFFEYRPDLNILNVSVKDRVVIPECMVWNHGMRLGGLADIFLFDRGKIIVQDYKTNAKLDYESFKGKKMYGVCKRLMDTNFSHYSIQLRIYQELAIMIRPEFKRGSNTIILTSSERHGRDTDTFIDCLNVEKEIYAIFDELKN